MASTSFSSEKKSFEYDVFLSFRGEDVRKNFVDHLYYALRRKDIITYKDDEEIKKGEKVKDQLNRSIEDSRFHIIVFSKNYASSSWCLGELVQIMECSKMNDHTAYPIFYDVEPTEVRNQSGAVGEAFAEHAEKEGAVRWRNALKEAADLAGWELKTTANGHEAKFIQEVVGEISFKLHTFNLSVDENLIGMETRVKNVLSLLETGADDVRMVGIKGIGGGGKTTLARAVFNYIFMEFDGASFVENVREVSKASLSGLYKLQEQILKDVLNDQSILVRSVYEGKKMMRKRMDSRKVLVILDDVNSIEQLQALAGGSTWFKKGSRIIITTRDAHILATHGKNFTINFTHDVNLLTEEEAICLFSKHAFQKEFPNQGYEELSKKVVNYAKGLPLTIEVLGSDLCSRTEHSVWKDMIDRLKKIPEEQTLERLKISYDGLQKDHQEIFLDVACILKGVRKDEAIQVLQHCRFKYNVVYGLEVLKEKSLVNISDDDRLLMHDLVEEMARNIVCQEHSDRRLWKGEETEEISVNDLGTEATRSIHLLSTNLQPTVIMQGLRKMIGLELFLVSGEHIESEVGEFREYLPNLLRYLSWCLPQAFQASKLVSLEMRNSNISQLWEGGERKVLTSLRFLNLSRSKRFGTFDFEMTPNLEILDLERCSGFVELHMPIKCPKLKSLNLFLSKVRNLNLGMTPNLEKLNLTACKGIVELLMPIELPHLKYLNLTGSNLKNLNLRQTPNIETLILEYSFVFVKLRMPIELPQLKLLNLKCTHVSYLNLSMAPNLEVLVLEFCGDLLELNMPDVCLKLKSLNLNTSGLRKLTLGATPNLETLSLEDCKAFVELNMSVELPQLKLLSLSASKLRNLNLGMSPHLEKLNLENSFEFVELHMPVGFPQLKFLNLSGSKVTNLNLGKTPNLETLKLERCQHFVEVQVPVECTKLKALSLNSFKVSNLTHVLAPLLMKSKGLENLSMLSLERS